MKKMWAATHGLQEKMLWGSRARFGQNKRFVQRPTQFRVYTPGRLATSFNNGSSVVGLNRLMVGIALTAGYCTFWQPNKLIFKAPFNIIQIKKLQLK